MAERKDHLFPWLHHDAPAVPAGLEPLSGVAYGCGSATCTRCYRPQPAPAGVPASDGWREAGLVCQACAGDAPGGKCRNPKCVGGPIVRELVPAGVKVLPPQQGENHGQRD